MCVLPCFYQEAKLPCLYHNSIWLLCYIASINIDFSLHRIKCIKEQRAQKFFWEVFVVDFIYRLTVGLYMYLIIAILPLLFGWKVKEISLLYRTETA